MTRLFTDGAETGDKLFWDGGAHASVTVTTPARSGSYAYRTGWSDQQLKRFFTASPEVLTPN